VTTQFPLSNVARRIRKGSILFVVWPVRLWEDREPFEAGHLADDDR